MDEFAVAIFLVSSKTTFFNSQFQPLNSYYHIGIVFDINPANGDV